MLIGAPVHITKANGDTVETTVSMRAVFEFEKSHGALVDALSNGRKVSDQWRLAWECCKAAKIVVKPFDTWLDELADVRIDWGYGDEGKDTPG